QLYRRKRVSHGLDIGVRNHELDALDTGLNHPVDRIAPTTTHADDFDSGSELLLIEHHRQPATRFFVECDHLPSPGRVIIFYYVFKHYFEVLGLREERLEAIGDPREPTPGAFPHPGAI